LFCYPPQSFFPSPPNRFSTSMLPSPPSLVPALLFKPPADVGAQPLSRGPWSLRVSPALPLVKRNLSFPLSFQVVGVSPSLKTVTHFPPPDGRPGFGPPPNFSRFCWSHTLKIHCSKFFGITISFPRLVLPFLLPPVWFAGGIRDPS